MSLGFRNHHARKSFGTPHSDLPKTEKKQARADQIPNHTLGSQLRSEVKNRWLASTKFCTILRWRTGFARRTATDRSKET